MDELAERTSSIAEKKTIVDIASLKEKHKGMEELPFLQTRELTGNFDGEPIGEEKVLTSAVVAAPNFESWAHEYHQDWAQGDLSSVEALAQALKKKGGKFWEEGKKHPVKLTKINGPKGPLYGVEDGSHRVAAAKLADTLEITAEVADLTERREFSTTKETTSLWWQALIGSGAIQGEINVRGNEKVLTLETTPELPWIIRPRPDFVKVNRVYREVYGNDSLVNTTSVPQEVLFDQGKAMIWENKVFQQVKN